MLSVVKKLLKFRKNEKIVDFSWDHYYYDQLGKKIKCRVLNDLKLEKSLILIDENGKTIKLNYEYVFDKDFYDYEEHMFI